MMRVMIVMITVLLTATMALSPSACVAQDTDENMRVSEGKVTAVDTAGSTITVQGGTSITFPVDADTQLSYDRYDNYAIKLSDITEGDYVTVEYLRSGLDSLVPYKVMKVSVKQTGSNSKLPQ